MSLLTFQSRVISSARRRRGTRGFTLLEVLVAVGIIALVGVLIYGSFMGMNRSRNNMNHVADRYQQGRQAVDRMARELSAAFLSAHVPFTQTQQQRRTAFIGTSGAGSARVDFTAFANLRLASNAHESDQCELGFFAARDPDSDKLDLVRRLSKHIDDDPQHGGVVQVLAENIDGFELKYLDPATNTWLESWDSTQPAGQPDRLPAQVWISLWLADGPGGVPVKFETKIPIPIQVPLNFATN